MVSEKKKLAFKIEGMERDQKEILREKNQQIAKYENSYRRFEEAMAKLTIAQQEKKESEEALWKRQKEINSLLKENASYKDELDGIRRRFGSLDEIHKKFEMAQMKEDKVNDLLSELENNMVSVF